MRLCLIKIFIIPNLVFSSLFLFESCSGFLSKKSIEQFALALKDHQENKKNTTNTSVDKNSKEIESPKDVTSSNKKTYDPILQVGSNQHMSDDPGANNKESLLNSSPAIMQNDSHAQNNVKMEENKSATPQHDPIEQSNFKNNLTATSKTPAIPSKEEIKANLDEFAQEKYEQTSLSEIKNAAQIVNHANPENKLNNTLLEFEKDYETLSNLLFSNLDTSPLNRKIKTIMPKLQEMRSFMEQATNSWVSAKGMLYEAKDKLAESIYKRLYNSNSYRFGGSFNGRDMQHAKNLAYRAIDFASECIEYTQKAIDYLQQGNSCKKEIENIIKALKLPV
ncbi:hypothetical protein KJD10_05920 (plasmid) [Borreliella valaisiana]|uniref:hypothetical protein n=1 Tax=Borreliella valaisiana TaxID=62088 RepID=UPI0027380ECC|nr:hypothetical protein [Borreliella valaisiana]WLN25926.1 hypothetical protein KJD10_05920 [Borreliella valaisiana]